MKDVTTNCKIRKMRKEDIDEIHAIEVKSFADPWSKSSMETMLEENNKTYCLVGTVNEEVVGYAFTWMIIDEMHIGDIAVREDFRNQGIGIKVMDSLLETAKERGCTVCWLEVRPSNNTALNLYERFGFIQVAVRKKYYSNNGEDALILARYF